VDPGGRAGAERGEEHVDDGADGSPHPIEEDGQR